MVYTQHHSAPARALSNVVTARLCSNAVRTRCARGPITAPHRRLDGSARTASAASERPRPSSATAARLRAAHRELRELRAEAGGAVQQQAQDLRGENDQLQDVDSIPLPILGLSVA